MEGTLNLVGYGLSAIGPAIATGMIFAAYISGVARQPEARSVLQQSHSLASHLQKLWLSLV